MSRLLGAIYGRLQVELLSPLMQRALAILRRRGEVPPVALDGTIVDVDYRSPLARVQAREEIRNTLLWLETMGKLGGDAARLVDLEATASWLAETLGVKRELFARPTRSDS